MPTHVSSTPELQTALKSAKGGDTILLKSGDYGSVDLHNLKFNDHVTIKSADGDGGARFKHITINNSSHVALDSLTLEYGPVALHNEKVIDIRNSDHVRIANSEIIGHTGTRDWSDVGRGIEAWQGSNNIEIVDNHIHHLSRAGLFFGNDITIKNNLIENIRMDGLFFGKSDSLLIENNFLTDFYRQGADHADYIQFDPGTTGPAHNVVIRGNVMLKGNGNGDVQGIFGANHHMDVHKGVFENFLVENNIYLDHGLNAVYFYSGKDMIVRNNTVLTDPADGRVVWARLTGPQTDSVLEDNVATQVNAEGGATAAGNVIVQYRDPANANYYGELFVDPFAEPATLADLAPKPDSPIGYGSGKGAEARFQELLDGRTPSPSQPDDSVVDDNPTDDNAVDDSAVDDASVDDSSVVASSTDARSTDARSTDDSSVDDTSAEDSPVDDNDSVDEGSADQGRSLDPVLSANPGIFTGKGSEVILPHQQSFELADGTLELKFTPETIAGRQALFSKDSLDYDDGGHLTVTVQDGAFIARLQSTSQTFRVQADNAISAGEEHHAAVSFGQNGLKLYLNGELMDSNSYKGGLTGNTEPVVLGAAQTLSGDGVADNLNGFFNGAIAGVAMYEDIAGSNAGADEFLLLN